MTSLLDGMVDALGGGPQSFWQDVVDTMNEGLLLVSPDRRIVYINKKAEELVGRTRAAVEGISCVDAINCPQCSCRCRLFDEGGVDGVPVTIYDHTDQRPRVLLKNGHLLRNDKGEVVGGVETFKDITKEETERQDNVRNVELLASEKTRNEALLGALRDGVFSLDREFRVLSFSPRMVDFTELEQQEAVGRNFFELLGLSSPFAGVSLAPDLDGRSCRVELKTGSGRRLLAEISFRKLRIAEGEVLGVMRPLHDGSDAAGEQAQGHSNHGIVSRSPKMQEIFRLLAQAAQSDSNILLEGESGTGKELVAQAIHRLSPRRGQPFYAVNCATFTGSLLLSELFGHERGAFTGAFRSTKGKLELAGDGTLFLDELSEIPLPYQAVLLRVVEERQFERVGGVARIQLRARIISATNERLLAAVRAGRFREDLYYRLKVVPIQVPPLRERPEDVALLATYFASHPAINLSGRRVRFTPEALDLLTAYQWPGNVRELRNLIEYLCFVADEVVDLDHLPAELKEQVAAVKGVRSAPPIFEQHDGDPDASERRRILQALEQANFRRRRAAELLGINRSTLWRRMRKLGVDLG